MKKFKIIASILILSAGLTATFLIIKNSLPAGALQKKTTAQTEDFLIAKPLSWKDNSLFKKISEAFSLSPNASDSQIVSDNQIVSQEGFSGNNLTEKFSQDIFKKIQAANSNGPAQKDGQSALAMPDAEKITQEIIQQSTADFDIAKIFPGIGPDNIKISQDVSAENQQRYLKEIDNISKKNFLGFNKQSTDILNEIMEKQDASSAQKLVQIYGNIIDDYYRIEVPTNWLKSHQIAISYFYGAKKIYENIADFKQDPLEAYLAAKTLPALEQAALGLQIITADEAEKNRLQATFNKDYNQ